MGPETIAAIVAAGGSLISLAAKFITAPDPAQVLVEMRSELAKMQAAIGPGGSLERDLAAHNKALDDAIEAEKAKQGGHAAAATTLVDPDKLP